MNRLKKIIIPSMGLLGVLLLFQNCGTYTHSDTLNSRIPASERPLCTPIELCQTEADGININIRGNQFVHAGAPQSVFDVAGYCDTGNFPGSYFEYRVSGPNHTTGLTRATQPTSGVIPTECKEGRFHFQIAVPASFYTAGVTHQITVSVVALAVDGSEVSSGNGMSQKAFQVTAQ